MTHHTAIIRALSAIAVRLAAVIIGLATTPTHAAPAKAAFCWLNAFAGDTGRASLSLNGQIVFRSIPGGTVCPWMAVAPGRHRHELATAGRGNLAGEWEIAAGARAMLVSHGKDQQACRLVMLPHARPGQSEWLNASDDGILEFEVAGAPGPAARPGFSLVADGTRDLVYTFPDGARWVFTLTHPNRADTDAPEQWYHVVHRAGADGPHDVMLHMLSLEKSDSREWMLQPPPPDAKSKRLRQGMISAVFQPPPAPPATSFAINAIDWTAVQSRLAWLNATSSNQTFSIAGHTVFRQIKAGSIAPFAPWPDGEFPCQSRANPGSLSGDGTFRLAKAGNAVIISIALKNQPVRMVHVHSFDSTAARGKKAGPTRLRLLNAFPSSRLALPARDRPLSLETGETSRPLEPARDLPQSPVLSGLTLTPPGGTARPLAVPTPNLATSTDWLLILFLDPVNPEVHSTAWLDLATARIVTPDDLPPAP